MHEVLEPPSFLGGPVTLDPHADPGGITPSSGLHAHPILLGVMLGITHTLTGIGHMSWLSRLSRRWPAPHKDDGPRPVLVHIAGHTT